MTLDPTAPAGALAARALGLLRSLFRSEPNSRSLIWLPAIPAVFLVATAIALLRVGDANGTLWGEDGSVFLQGEHDSGYVHTVLLGYDGYLHLVPRTLAWIAEAFPLSEWALSISVASAVVTGLVAAFVSRAAAAYGLGRWVSLAVGLLVPLSPVALFECSDVAANIQWFLAAGCFWSLFWAPREWRWVAAGSALVFLTAGSAPLCLTFVPVAVLRLIILRGRDRVLPALFLAGSALQVFTMTNSTRQGIVEPTSAVDFLRTAALRLYTVSWLGPSWTISGLDKHGLAVLFVTAAVWSLVIAGCVRSGPALLLLLAGVLGATALWTAGSYFNYLSTSFTGGSNYAGIVLNGRYTSSPSVIIVSVALASLALARRKNKLAIPIAALLVCLAVAVSAHDFRYGAPRQSGPPLAVSLVTARQACAVEGTTSAVIGVAPIAAFDLRLPCSMLVPSR